MIRRLDHVAVLVSDTDNALRYFRDRLGLEVVHDEEITAPAARLTYLNAGNVYLQLVQPRDDSSRLAESLQRNGEGLHHLCFGVDDVGSDARAIGDGSDVILGGGRGRVSAFAPGTPAHGVTVECTEFDHRADVTEMRGMLGG